MKLKSSLRLVSLLLLTESVFTSYRSMPPFKTTESYQISLIGGRDNSEGNVEVSINNEQFGLCDSFWDDNEATVTCKMLGYSSRGIATRKSFFGSDDVTIMYGNIECSGTETNLSHCRTIEGRNNHNCSANELVGVICGRASASSKVQIPDKKYAAGKCGRLPTDNTDILGDHRKRNIPIDPLIPLSSKDDGRQFQQHKIVGGHFAEKGEIPWQVILLYVNPNARLTKRIICGGAIISEFWIISVAHCFVTLKPSNLLMIVGDYSKHVKNVEQQQFDVDLVIAHDLYNSTTQDYDFALIKIKPTRDGRGIQFNTYVQPVCLPDSTTSFHPGTKCVVSGWGNVKSKFATGEKAVGDYPAILKAADVPLMEQKQCEYLHNSPPGIIITPRMLCAGYLEGGIDTCDGDSGGPLICSMEGVHTLIGLTSWGEGCAQPNSPGVYSRVSAFVPWIYSTIKSRSINKAHARIPSKK